MNNGILWMLAIILIVMVVIVAFYFIQSDQLYNSSKSNQHKSIEDSESPLKLSYSQSDSETRVEKDSIKKQETEKYEIKDFIIEADDKGFYVDEKKISFINVDKGNEIKIIFNVRESNVYYGGLDFRGDSINTGKVAPGDSTNLEFIAKNDFEIRSYWPSSDRLKSKLSINVI